MSDMKGSREYNQRKSCTGTPVKHKPSYELFYVGATFTTISAVENVHSGKKLNYPLDHITWSGYGWESALKIGLPEQALP